jgi:large conductance mechanosensitive channel
MDMKGHPVNRTRNFWNDFKAFAFSDSLLKVAVAFVLATAFTVLIKAFVDSFIMPLIAAIVGDTSFEDLVFTVNGSTFTYGSFLSALITFILVAFVLFLVVKSVIRVMGEKAETTSCPACTEDVSIVATRCPHCTSELTPTA